MSLSSAGNGSTIRGNRGVGMKVWVFGIVERSSNRLLLFPVESRDAATLTKIIEKHVEKGSTIYSDGWSASGKLNELGYRHFSVIHKYAFSKKFKNVNW